MEALIPSIFHVSFIGLSNNVTDNNQTILVNMRARAHVYDNEMPEKY